MLPRRRVAIARFRSVVWTARAGARGAADLTRRPTTRSARSPNTGFVAAASISHPGVRHPRRRRPRRGTLPTEAPTSPAR